MDVLVICKYEEDPIKNEGARVDTTFSPLYPYWSYLLPWTPEFRSDLPQNLMQPFSHPNDGSGKILLRLAHWLRRYSSLKIFTDARTDARTDAQSDIYWVLCPYGNWIHTIGYKKKCSHR